MLILSISLFPLDLRVFLLGEDHHGEEDVEVHVGSALEKCLRDENEAVEVQLHINLVDRLLVQHDQPGGTRQEDLLRGGEQSKPKVAKGQEPIPELNVVEFPRVGLDSIVEGVQALVLNPTYHWTGFLAAEEDFLLVHCPVAWLPYVGWIPASVVL